jgi:tetratricopeptide (TPR) repeat protein
VVGQLHIHALPAILHDLAAVNSRKVESLYTFIYRRAWDNLDEPARRLLLAMPLTDSHGGDLDFLASVSALGDGDLRHALDTLVMLNLVDARGELHHRLYTIHSLTRTFLQEQVAKWQPPRFELTAPLSPPAPAADYPALFGDYVVRGAVALCSRLTAPRRARGRGCAPARPRAAPPHLCLEPDAAWPAARDLLLALAEPMEQAGARSAWLPFLTRGVARSVALTRWRRRGGTDAALRSSAASGERLCRGADRGWPAANAALRRDDRRGVARARNQQAYLACLQHRDEAAVALAERALALLAAEDDERAMSYFVLGMVAINRWQWAEAEQHHRATLAIRHARATGGARPGRSRTSAMRCKDSAATPRPSCFEAAAAALADLDDQANRAIVLMNLARTYHLDGQLDDALATGQAARLALHAVGDRFHSAGPAQPGVDPPGARR